MVELRGGSRDGRIELVAATATALEVRWWRPRRTDVVREIYRPIGEITREGLPIWSVVTGPGEP